MKNLLLISLLLIFFPHRVNAFTEEEVTFSESPYILSGTFTIPEGNGPHPVVILNHGSGPNDRNQRVEGNNLNCLYAGLAGQTIQPNRDIAHALAENGFAVLRYDKRSYTYGHTMQFEKVFRQFADDIHHAIDYAKNRPETDPERIILTGYSKSASLTPIVASERNDISALINFVGPHTHIDTLLPYQIRHIYKHCADEATGEQIASELEDDFQMVRQGENPGNIMGAPASYWAEWMAYTDSGNHALDNLDIPTLLLFGEDDYQVPPSEADSFKRHLNREIDIWTIDHANHFLTSANNAKVLQSVHDTLYHWLSNQNLTTNLQVDVTQKWINPQIRYTTDRITIHFGDYTGNGYLTLTDLQGRKVMSTEIQNGTPLEISKSDLPEGLYILHGNLEAYNIRGKVQM